MAKARNKPALAQRGAGVRAQIRGGKGGGSSHTPVEAPDSLRSISCARILDIVSEGQINGFALGPDRALECIYLDKTAIGNADGTLNFQNVQVDSRSGTQNQTYMAGFPAVENEVSVGVELKSGTPFVRAITDLDLTAIRVLMSLPNGLQKSNTSNGDINGYSISYTIEIQADSGAWVTMVNGAFSGKASSNYERSHRIDLPPATSGWNVRITRITPNANSAAVADTTDIVSLTEIVDGKFTYPNSALVGLLVDASQFQSVPTRGFDLEGIIIQVPSNYDPVARTYSGAWDGSFKPAYSNNPAWCYYELATNPRYALGDRIANAQVNKWALYNIGVYCDGMVPDGKGGLEPRMTCNAYLQTTQDAYKVLNDLATVFRGLSYYANGMIQAVADMPADPVYTYTDANVVPVASSASSSDGTGNADGILFSYSGTTVSTTYTVALVSWNDPSNFYSPAVEPVHDDPSIARFGIIQTQVTAFGCTSQGQAQRFGRWTILTSQLEGEIATWTVGLDGTLALPGQIVRLADSNRMGRRVAGRISMATSNSIAVDSTPTASVGDILTVTLPAGVTESHTIASIAGRVITISGTFSDIPVPQSVWLVESTELTAPTYRVLTRKDNGDLTYTFTAARHIAGKFDAIDNGTIIQVPPTSLLLPKVQPAPAAVYLSSAETAGEIVAATVLTISWPSTPAAVSYLPQYQANNGEWVSLPSCTGLSVDVQHVQPGQYLARVAAVNAAGNASSATVSAAFTVADQTKAPTALANAAALAAEASAAASEAQADADAANADLADIASDGILSPNEKPRVIQDVTAITNEQSGIDAQATAFAITTEKNAYDNAVSALSTYLTGLTTPTLWSDLTGNTTIVGTTFRSTFLAVYGARQTLLNKIAQVAKAQADAGVTNAAAAAALAASAQTAANTAQTAANAANAQLADIASDGILSPNEKPTVIRDSSVITTEQAGIDAQATAYGITTEKTTYDNAVSALQAYLASLTTPVLWSNLAGNTTIVGATFRANFANVYTAKQALLNKIVAVAQSLANAAQSTANGATALASQVPVVNPGFESGATGWSTADATNAWAVENNGNGPNAGNTNHLAHGPVSGGPVCFFTNAALAPVTPGQTFRVTVKVRSISNPNGAGGIRFAWIDNTGAVISAITGNGFSGTSQGASTAVGVAPANTVAAQVSCYSTGQTTGYFTYDDVQYQYQPTNSTELADTGNLARAGDSLTRFVDRTASNIAYASGTSVEGLKPAQAGATNGAPAGSLVGSIDAAIIAAGNTPGGNMVFNSLFALGAAFWSLATGWFVTSNALGQPALVIGLSGSVGTQVCISSAMPCTAGVAYSFSMDAWLQGALSAGDISCDVQFYNASGGSISGSLRPFQLSTPNGGFVRYALNNIVSPAGAASCVIRIFTESVTASSATGFYCRRVKLEQGATATPFNDDATQNGNQLTIPNSGQQIGNQANIPMIGVGNFRSTLANSISGTVSTPAGSTTSTGTITAAAFTMTAGSKVVNYGAMTASISGTAGSTATYYLYTDDPNYQGGTRTMIATTNSVAVYQADGRLYIGSFQVTFPAAGSSGGGTGGGGGGNAGGNCVCAWMYIAAERTAEFAQVGDVFDCLDLPTRGLEKFQRELQGMELVMAPCVRITTDAGAQLDCSSATPFDLLDGRTTPAESMLGEQVITDLGIEKVISVELIGERPVCRNHLGGVSYAAGRDAGHRIYSHNFAKP